MNIEHGQRRPNVGPECTATTDYTNTTEFSPSADDDFIVLRHDEEVGNPLGLESLARRLCRLDSTEMRT